MPEPLGSRAIVPINSPGLPGMDTCSAVPDWFDQSSFCRIWISSPTNFFVNDGMPSADSFWSTRIDMPFPEGSMMPLLLAS